MKPELISCFLIFAAPALVMCSPQQTTASDSANDTPEMAACRMGAESMIDVARQAVNDQSSRPERRESRRVLVEDWVARLEAGEDPCSVYVAIGNASTTF